MADSKNRRWIRKMRDPRLVKAFTRITLLMDGHELSVRDKERVYDAYLSEAILLLDVSRQLDEHNALPAEAGYSRDFSTSNLTRMLIAWSKIDVMEYIDSMKSMLLCLRDLSSMRGCVNEPSFNAWLAAHEVQRSSVVVRPFLRLLKDVYKTLDPTVFALANTVFQYTVRLTLTDVDWVEEDEITSYLENEEIFKSQTYDVDLLDEVRAVCRWWLRDFSFENARGRHGYGATAGVKRSLGTAAKYKDFLPTHETAILASWLNWWPIYEFWPGITERHAELLFEELGEEDTPHNVDQLMHYNLVPKAFNKKRGVSMEPTSHMFMQKMIFGLMDDYFNSHPECHVHLHDQERNRRLCVEGSRHNTFATIDLSAASDSVTNTLVKYVLQDTLLGDALQLCRTPNALLTHADGSTEVVELEKFAPMGSAVCFPVECLIFSAIVAVAQQRLGIDDKYCVYGDDIVCSTRAFDTVVDLLTQLNFRVNTDKSYGHGSDFTESCGMEAYKGFDVSPLRMSRKWDVTKLRPTGRSRKEPDTSTILSAAYDAVNEAGDRGFVNLRAYRLQQLLDKYPRAMFSRNKSMGIFSNREDIAYAYPVSRMRLNEDLQRVEILCTAIRSTTSAGPDLLRWSKLAEEYCYTNRSSLLTPEDRIEAKCGAAHTYVKTVWVPLQDLM